jgi:RNA polymerase sigma-70 factor (ECF subfamily)
VESNRPADAVDDGRDMAALAAGDREALERIYARYAGRLSGFFWRLGAKGGEIDELVHESFVRLWCYGTGWRGDSRFSTYLFGIARSAWLDRREEAARAPRTPPPRGEPERPEQAAERRELVEAVERAVAELSDPLRQVFSLVSGGGLKYREAAELLGIPVGTVKSRLAAAEEKLRRQLSRYLEGRES